MSEEKTRDEVVNLPTQIDAAPMEQDCKGFVMMIDSSKVDTLVLNL